MKTKFIIMKTGTNTESQLSKNSDEIRNDKLYLIKTMFKIIFDRFINDRTYAPIRTIINELMKQADQDLKNFFTDELQKIPGPGPKKNRNKK